MNDRMVDELRELGVARGDVVLMHSSFKSLGEEGKELAGGPEGVIRAMMRVVGEEGALLMPALTYAYCHSGQRLFDVTKTKSCVGVISETFRNMQGVKRSVHPTHSVCGWGAKAVEMLCEHHLDDTPCGERSPFAKVRDVGGKVLMLGCGLEPNTSMHGVEEVVRPDYVFKYKLKYRVQVGKEPWRSAVDAKDLPDEIENWRHGHSEFGYAQRYDRLGTHLGGVGRQGKVLGSVSWLMDARGMWEVGERLMRENEHYFVARIKIGSEE